MMNIFPYKRNSKGFTLVELLVVVAIISLLSSVVMAALKDTRNKAKLSSIKEMALSLRTEGQIYSQDNSNIFSSNPNIDYKVYKGDGSDIGFFNSPKTMEIVNQILKLTGGKASYAINSSSWVIVFDTSLIAFVKPLIPTAYAAIIPSTVITGTSYICLDSIGNITFNKEPFTTGPDFYGPSNKCP